MKRKEGSRINYLRHSSVKHQKSYKISDPCCITNPCFIVSSIYFYFYSSHNMNCIREEVRAAMRGAAREKDEDCQTTPQKIGIYQKKKNVGNKNSKKTKLNFHSILFEQIRNMIFESSFSPSIKKQCP